MMLPQMIFLGMVVAAFITFIVTLGSTSLSLWLWDRLLRGSSSGAKQSAGNASTSASQPDRGR